jgi:hypothetical protein
MKVYLLEQQRNSGGIYAVDIFNKPKDARKYIDTLFGINTKNCWKKCEGGSRRYEMEDFTWFITEFSVKGK